jgi:hypothetical protein
MLMVFFRLWSVSERLKPKYQQRHFFPAKKAEAT